MKYRFGSKPKRGDIVRLKDPTGDPESIIKRVVAVGSDRVTFENDRIVVNGTQIHPNTVTRVQRPSTVIIPKNTLFVMGDNENNSVDSRMFGPVPVSYVKGRAALILWPLNRIRRL